MDRLRRHPICVMTCLGLAASLWGVLAAALTSPARAANKRFDHRGRYDVALVPPITAVSGAAVAIPPLALAQRHSPGPHPHPEGAVSDALIFDGGSSIGLPQSEKDPTWSPNPGKGGSLFRRLRS